MTRIIGGTARGRRLQTPRGDRTRPTSDRVREALFSAVEAWCGLLHELRVLDLYAGTGAIGLEAHSRGAAAVTFVESDRRTAQLVRANADVVGLATPDVRAATVATVLATPPGTPYDLVVSDPPYQLTEEALARDLALLADGWLHPDALVVVERSARTPEPTWPPGLEPQRERTYGETRLWFAAYSRPS